LISNSENTTTNYNVDEQTAIGEPDLFAREQTVQSTEPTINGDYSTEIIDLTNDSEIEDAPNITIDIYKTSQVKQKKSKHDSRPARSQDQFINITAEDFVSDMNKRKKKSSRREKINVAAPNVITRSMARNT